MSRPNSMKPSSILLIEDETLIRMMLAGMVDELGHRVAGEASSIREACLLAETTEYDLAMLDVDLGGHSISPVAAIIAKRGLPILFVTGYAPTGLPDEFDDRPMIQKPFTLARLRDGIEMALIGPSPQR
jgi:CheY-like chemotaxis protein